MSHTHAVPNTTRPAPGQCTWEHYSHGVLLDCIDGQIPGEALCWEHYIAHVQSTPDPDADIRTFGPTVIPAHEVTSA